MRGVRERNQKLVAALTFPPAPPSAPPRGEKGGMSEAGAISRTRSPLSRNAGEGLGVRASRSAGAEGGMSVAAAILRLSTIPRSRTTPLPQRGRGAGGEGLPQRGRGAGGEGAHGTFPTRNPGC